MTSNQKAWAILAAIILVLVLVHLWSEVHPHEPTCIPAQMECEPYQGPLGQ